MDITGITAEISISSTCVRPYMSMHTIL